jgi:hypothetical protein
MPLFPKTASACGAARPQITHETAVSRLLVDRTLEISDNFHVQFVNNTFIH